MTRTSLFCATLACLCWATAGVSAGQAGGQREPPRRYRTVEEIDAPGANLALVIGPRADRLERYAAKELRGYLAKLYGIKVTPTTTLPAAAKIGLLVGNPRTNPAVAKALGEKGWPRLSDQGIVLKRGTIADKPVLVIGGGSPVATLWAVYELVERWGVRYLLHGDVLPDHAGRFRLPEKDVLLEPSLRVRQWRVINDFACGPESWGMDQYRPVLDQLAKLRFNRILLSIYPWQPFLHLEHRGVARRSAWLWFKFKYPITDDMIGRGLFDDRPEFWNPDLPYGASYEELAAGGEKLVHRLMARAHDRGMKCVLTAHLLEFPPEFKETLRDAQPVHQLGSHTVVPGGQTRPDDPALTALATTVLRTIVDTYPEVDYLHLGMPEHRQWVALYETAWNALDAKYGIEQIEPLADVLVAAGGRTGYPGGAARAVREVKGDIVILQFYDRLLRELHVLADSKRANVKFIYSSVAEELFPVLAKIVPPGSETLNFIDYTPARVVKRRAAIGKLDTRGLPACLIYTLHDDNVGLLPALSTGSLHELTKELRQHGWSGFSTRYWLIADHDPCVAYIARAAWDETATPESVYRDQLRATCGEPAVADMLTMLHELEETAVLLEWHGLGLAFPVPGMIMKHWHPGAMPAMYVKARAGYQRALAAARRARAKTPAKKTATIDYWIGRLQFGVGYFDTIEAVRLAATAEDSGQGAAALQHAEHALAKARSALAAYARIARDQSDRGAIATLNQYVYRPLQQKVHDLRTPSEQLPFSAAPGSQMVAMIRR